jgi:hypothetical protein
VRGQRTVCARPAHVVGYNIWSWTPHYEYSGAILDWYGAWGSSASETPPPRKTPWTFGVLDQQHLTFIMNTGANQPMTVKSVVVWQA